MKKDILKLIGLYKTLLEIAGDKSLAFKRSIFYFIISFFLQGLVFSCFYPLFYYIIKMEVTKILLWLILALSLTILSLFFKNLAYNFNYNGDLIDINCELKLKLGEKLKSIPF